MFNYGSDILFKSSRECRERRFPKLSVKISRKNYTGINLVPSVGSSSLELFLDTAVVYRLSTAEQPALLRCVVQPIPGRHYSWLIIEKPMLLVGTLQPRLAIEFVLRTIRDQMMYKCQKQISYILNLIKIGPRV